MSWSTWLYTTICGLSWHIRTYSHSPYWSYETLSSQEPHENGNHTNHSKVSPASGGDKCWDPFLLNGESLGSSGRASPSNDDQFADSPSNPDDEERVRHFLPQILHIPTSLPL